MNKSITKPTAKTQISLGINIYQSLCLLYNGSRGHMSSVGWSICLLLIIIFEMSITINIGVARTAKKLRTSKGD